MLQNVTWLAIVAVHTEENEPLKILKVFNSIFIGLLTHLAREITTARLQQLRLQQLQHQQKRASRTVSAS